MSQKASGLSLIARRTIDAPAERLFAAWITPSALLAWWGPRGVRCSHAEVDARVGGRFRLGNELPDGRTIWIAGEFLEVDPPTRLVYTWTIEPSTGPAEIVTVRFESRADARTEVIVVHDRIAREEDRKGHADGWVGCLEGLDEWVRREPG